MSLKKSSSQDMSKIANELWKNKEYNPKLYVEKAGSVKKEATYDISYAQTQFYSPRLTPDTWYLPRTRKMLLKWVKIFFDWDPAVYSILTMHSRYPISDFNLVTDNTKQKDFFEGVLNNEEWNIIDTLREGSLSLKKNGEAIIFGDWDSENGVWKGFTLLDPALIEVEDIPFTNKVKIYAEIPKKYVNLVKSSKEEDKERVKGIPEVLITAIKEGKKFIELDTEEGTDENDNYSPPKVCMLINKTDVGDNGLRGLPPITPVMKTLVFQDYLRKAQMARAQRYAYPIEIWKVGDVAANILPDDAVLEDVQNMLRQALASPPFSIVYSPLIDLEIKGAVGNLLPIYEDLSYCLDQILIGLGTNKNVVLGEGSWMGSAKTISMQRLIMDYKVDRDMWTRKFLQNFVLRPMCMYHGYTVRDPISNKLKPKMPKISWTRSLDIQQEEDNKKLYMDMWDKGLISSKTLYAQFPDLDYVTEVRNIEREKNSILDGVGRELPKMNAPFNEEAEQLKEDADNAASDIANAPKPVQTKPTSPAMPVMPAKPENTEEAK